MTFDTGGREEPLRILVLTFVLIVATASAGRAQAQDLFSHVDSLALSDGSLPSGQVSVARDTAIVFREGQGVHVFERQVGSDNLASHPNARRERSTIAVRP
jgi:hypothetical protein